MTRPTPPTEDYYHTGRIQAVLLRFLKFSQQLEKSHRSRLTVQLSKIALWIYYAAPWIGSYYTHDRKRRTK